MFQRFKGFNLDSFLESKLAEDEAKKAQQQAQQSKSSTKRTPSTARRGSARAGTPNGRREGSRLRVSDGEGPLPTKAPDPEDFVIGDDASDISAISRAATPRPIKEGEDGPVTEEQKEGTEQDADAQKAALPEQQRDASAAGKGKEKVAPADDELPLEVRRRLAKLDTLTTKYQDLLKNYRMAHSRVAAIEPFEATLREHTSLTSISDPGALVEFLEARNLQKDMVMEELKRISGEHGHVVKERDELKVKLEVAEKNAKEAFDEAAGLRNERETNNAAAPPSGPDVPVQSLEASDGADHSRSSNTLPVEDETFFDYDTELAHLQEELREQKVKVDEQTAYINEISTENATLRQSYDVAQLDLSAMYNKIDVKVREVDGLKKELEAAAVAKKAAEDQEGEASASLAQTEGQIFDLQTRLKSYQEDVEKEKKELQNKLEASEKKYQLEHDEGQQDKRRQFQEKILNSVREQLKEAQHATSASEGKYKDLELEFNRLSSECDNKGEIISRLRGQEDANRSLRDRNVELERERDDAIRVMDGKKQHEAAAASLRSQLKRTEKDRDDAYQMILKCGQCQKPLQNGQKGLIATEAMTQASTPASESRRDSEATEQLETSTQPTEVGTPPIEVDIPASGEAKKKNKSKKKKSKAKKEPVESGEASKVDEQKPTQVNDSANQHLKFVMDKIQADEDENDRLLRHHEGKIEEQEQAIRAHLDTIKQKDDEIAGLSESLEAEEKEVKKLNGKLKDQEGLASEIEDLRDRLLDLGEENTNFKHERKTATEGQTALQKELDEAQIHSQELRKSRNEIERERNELLEKCKKFDEEQDQETDQKIKALEERNASLQREMAMTTAMHQKQTEELQSQVKANEGDTANLIRSQNDNLKKTEAQKSEIEQKLATALKDLTAANSLAQTRFKDLAELREHSNKLQAELKKVKDEVAELRSAKSDLEKLNTSLKKLEAKEKDLRSEIAEYKSQITEKDTELASLRDQVNKSDERSSALEDTCERARRDLEENEKTRDDAVDARDKAQAGLKRVESELRSAKSTLDDLQKQVAKFRSEATGLRKEIESKTALLTSSQNLADGYQDQQREMAAQVKEHRDRADGLEEELGDVHRLLFERGREGETMRRLIEDVKNERDRKVREMQEERDRATEDRDRADDEASSIGRRKAREIQELKTKLFEAEKEASKAKEAREDAERRERDFRSLREDLEKRAAKAEEDLAQRRDAMAQIQQTLDESQRHYADLDREKSDLRRTLEERQSRLEKVQKSSKAMAEELQGLKAAGRAPPRAGSTRTSVDSSRVTSPVPGRGGGNNTPQPSTALDDDMINRAVIRSTLLNFMQQKDKRVQMSMVGPGGPLAKMLGFGPQDEQSWMSAVSTR